MDLLTQGVLGAALAQSGAKPTETRMATGIGFAAGLLADADALINSSTDSLLAIEYHRHFTHSIFFIPFGALIAAILLWPFLRKRIRFGRLYVFSLLGYSLSGFIDACTSYGTHLFWPIWDERVSFHLVAIVDPIFTLLLITGVIVAYRKRLQKPAQLGLMLAASYLLLAFVQLHRAEAMVESLAAERGHIPKQLVAKPTFGNILLWRSIYKNGGRFYIDAVRVGKISRIYEGESIAEYEQAKDGNHLPKDSVLYADIQRFSKFSDGYIAIHPDRADVLGDIRYSIQPDGIRPLWGIEMDTNNPERHAYFTVFRSLDKTKFKRFLAMLKNEEVE